MLIGVRATPAARHLRSQPTPSNPGPIEPDKPNDTSVAISPSSNETGRILTPAEKTQSVVGNMVSQGCTSGSSWGFTRNLPPALGSAIGATVGGPLGALVGAAMGQVVGG